MLAERISVVTPTTAIASGGPALHLTLCSPSGAGSIDQTTAQTGPVGHRLKQAIMSERWWFGEWFSKLIPTAALLEDSHLRGYPWIVVICPSDV